MLSRIILHVAVFSAAVRAESVVSSYSNPEGTSYTVPLTNSYSAPAPSNAVSYSVSADDLERSSDLSGAASSTNFSPNFQKFSSYPSSSPSLASPAPVYNPNVVVEAEEKSGSESTISHQSPASEYAAAPAPASTGNLYYYYYPVQAQPIVEKSDEEELDPLVVILLPITVLVGFLALLSIVNTTFVAGRSGDARSMQGETKIDSIKGQIDVMLEQYYQVLESEQCMDRVVCELGTKASGLSGKDYLLKAVDYLIPEIYTRRVDTFKVAVQEGYDADACKVFSCDAKNLIQVRRK